VHGVVEVLAMSKRGRETFEGEAHPGELACSASYQTRKKGPPASPSSEETAAVNRARQGCSEVADKLWEGKSTGSINFQGANEKSYFYRPDPALSGVVGLGAASTFKKDEIVAVSFWDTKAGYTAKGNADSYTGFCHPIRGVKDDFAYMAKGTPTDLAVLINTGNVSKMNNCRFVEIPSIRHQGHETKGTIKVRATRRIEPGEFFYVPYARNCTRQVRAETPPIRVVKATVPFEGIKCDTCNKRFSGKSAFKKLRLHQQSCK
jgi:hypothetical protein